MVLQSQGCRLARNYEFRGMSCLFVCVCVHECTHLNCVVMERLASDEDPDTEAM